MAQVTLTVNGRNYDVTCDDGQESQLQDLAAELDGRVQQLVRSVGQPGEARLLLLAGLLMVDEMRGLRANGSGEAAAAGSMSSPAEGAGEDETQAELLGAVADHIETLVARHRDV